MRPPFNDYWEMASQSLRRLEWGYEDSEMVLFESEGITYFQFGDSLIMAHGDRPVTLESIEQRVSEPGWARGSFEHYKKIMVNMTDEERLESLCIEAERFCITLRQLEEREQWGWLDTEKIRACNVFRAIYELTLRQNPPRPMKK